MGVHPVAGQPAGALKKAAELKELGVEDYFIVQEEGEHRWALSLGVFRSEERRRRASPRCATRACATPASARATPRVPKVWLQVKGVDAPLQARLKEIARQIEGSELKDCP